MANALTRWLGLGAPRAAPSPRCRPASRSLGPVRSSGCRGVRSRANPGGGRRRRAGGPSDLAGAVGAAIAAARPSYLVVRRPGERHDYAFPAEEALERLAAERPDRSVDEVFDLHESDASDPVPLSAIATGGVSRGSLHLDSTRAPTARRQRRARRERWARRRDSGAARAADVTALREFASRAAAAADAC